MPVTLNEVSTTDKYAFFAEWFDAEASILRKFYFFYFPFDGTIEMFDQQRNKRFLKRTAVEGIEPRDIYVGNTMKIFNRQVRLIDYANVYTKRKMGEAMQKTFVLLKPDGVKSKCKIIQAILNAGFKICNMRMLYLTEKVINETFLKEEDNKLGPQTVEFLLSGPVIVMELIGENAVKKFEEVAGDADPKRSASEYPLSLRALYGSDVTHNVLECATTDEEAKKLNDYFFGPNRPPASSETSTVVLQNSSCCIVKPHAVRKGHLGDIMCKIEEEGYRITALQMFYVDHVSAEEFYEVYKGVSQEFGEMVTELASGGCVAMEITGPMGEDTPSAFRTFVGPPDPDLARQLRPNTLRALYGEDKVKNALHVTDLPEDGVLESRIHSELRKSVEELLDPRVVFIVALRKPQRWREVTFEVERMTVIPKVEYFFRILT